MSTTDATQSRAEDLFRQALTQFESMIRMNVKLQEETVKLLLAMMRDPTVPHEWLKRTLEVVRQAIPAAHRNFDEAFHLMNDSAQSSLHLLQQTLESIQNGSPQDASHKTRELWESALKAVRDDMQAITEANEHVLSSWEELLARMSGSTSA